ncbi:beta-1,6-N-acetylglucosaminyltransferase [Neobacillus jeddahensis]|uniref:beta-1,6-N-acetylglucosaminyltransferase n=1 Tax=Neobacillus jeddahensis TaxID=1461580 RepID=UPI00058DFDDE|nr:beta-1,6-N-acetylglucosaminyltransferase [Neobacillus jeddahensis]
MNSLRTAFILQIHKNPRQVNRFIDQLLSDDQADVYVHIDKRSYKEIYHKILKHSNVKVLENSVVCEWGNISQITATILLLREVLASKKNYDYVCLRSGQDLLVKDGFKGFLSENSGKIFMGFREIKKKDLVGMEINWPKVTRSRYNSAHPFRIYRRIIHDLYQKGFNLFPNKNQWPNEYMFFTGSQWFTIPLEAAKYIIEFIDKNEWYYRFFENTLAPDEWFFHTLIMNSPFKVKVVKNNYLFLKWGGKFTDIGSPVCLTFKDIQQIEESNDFFARKFDEDIDKAVIEYFSNKVGFGGNPDVSIKING